MNIFEVSVAAELLRRRHGAGQRFFVLGCVRLAGVMRPIACSAENESIAKE